mmetsp:Transcript_15339/g.19651  ORF Transcript_15339/g.19651 Transcript_15339/m.19651 type:complete len:159 (+) Transcript_15339:204-680(+)
MLYLRYFLLHNLNIIFIQHYDVRTDFFPIHSENLASENLQTALMCCGPGSTQFCLRIFSLGSIRLSKLCPNTDGDFVKSFLIASSSAENSSLNVLILGLRLDSRLYDQSRGKTTDACPRAGLLSPTELTKNEITGSKTTSFVTTKREGQSVISFRRPG